MHQAYPDRSSGRSRFLLWHAFPALFVLAACSNGSDEADNGAAAARFTPPIVSEPLPTVEPRVTETHRYVCPAGQTITVGYYQGGEDALLHEPAGKTLRLEATAKEGVFTGAGVTLTRAGRDVLLQRGTKMARRCRG